MVLVPLRGNTFLNNHVFTVYSLEYVKFSSPYGVIPFLTLSLESGYFS